MQVNTGFSSSFNNGVSKVVYVKSFIIIQVFLELTLNEKEEKIKKKNWRSRKSISGHPSKISLC